MAEIDSAQMEVLLATLRQQESALDQAAQRLRRHRDRLDRAWASEETPMVIAHLDRQRSQLLRATRELAALQVDIRQVLEDLAAEAAEEV